MKVAMLTTTGERCGIAAYSRALVEAMRGLPDTEVEVLPITEGKQSVDHYLAQAERFNAPDIDVVHIQHEHSFWGGILPRTSAYWDLRYLIQKPVVLTAHTTYTAAEMLRIATERRPHKWLGKKILLRNQEWVDSVEIAPFTTAITIVHTAGARNALISRGAKPGYVYIVPTGIPAPVTAPTGGKAFVERYRLVGRRLLTIFGYVAPNKGYELALEVLPSLPQDVALVIAGGARTPDMEPYQAQVRARIEASGLADRVVLTGFLSDEDVAEAMEASEIVFVPHTQATGSYSVTLPISHGRPILASDLDCFREVSARIDCVELFRACDAADCRSKLTGLLDSPARRGVLAANALKYAARYSWPRIAAQTRHVYKSAIDVYNSGPHHNLSGPIFKSDQQE
jgi:glycosyltransferase involved in cell wall biosynthesis